MKKLFVFAGKMLDDPNRKYVPKKEFITYSVSALGQGMIYAVSYTHLDVYKRQPQLNELPNDNCDSNKNKYTNKADGYYCFRKLH